MRFPISKYNLCYLQVQSDLEHKINAIMEKLSSIEESRHQQQPQSHLAATTESYGHMHELQSRLDEVTQLRLKQLEKMQEKQMEWQVRKICKLKAINIHID